MFVPLFVPLVLLRLLRLSSRWTHSGRIADRSWRCLGHVPERFWTHKKAQNRFRQFCASVFVPERFPAGAGCTFGVRTGRTLRSIVVVRPFCLRASAFPFGAAQRAVSPGPTIRHLFSSGVIPARSFPRPTYNTIFYTVLSTIIPKFFRILFALYKDVCRSRA